MFHGVGTSMIIGIYLKLNVSLIKNTRQHHLLLRAILFHKQRIFLERVSMAEPYFFITKTEMWCQQRATITSGVSIRKPCKAVQSSRYMLTWKERLLHISQQQRLDILVAEQKKTPGVFIRLKIYREHQIGATTR